MSETTIRAAADELLRFAAETGADHRGDVIRAYTLGAVGQAAQNALRELDGLLALRPADHARIRDAALARVRGHLLDAMAAREALGLALEERRRSLEGYPESHGARRSGGMA